MDSGVDELIWVKELGKTMDGKNMIKKGLGFPSLATGGKIPPQLFLVIILVAMCVAFAILAQDFGVAFGSFCSCFSGTCSVPQIRCKTAMGPAETAGAIAVCLCLEILLLKQ